MEYKEITFKGVDIKVGYNYEKGDSGVWRDADGGGYPSTPSSAEIYEMTIKGVDVMELLDVYCENIEQIIINEIER